MFSVHFYFEFQKVNQISIKEERSTTTRKAQKEEESQEKKILKTKMSIKEVNEENQKQKAKN